MKYFVYFDAYGQARKWVSEQELVQGYGNDTEVFRQTAAQGDRAGEMGTASGTIGVLNFENEKELREYLQSLGEEIEGFFNCASDSRPYNF